MDRRLWRYKAVNDEKGRLSNSQDHISVVCKRLGCIWALQMQGHVEKNIQWFLRYVISSKRQCFLICTVIFLLNFMSNYGIFWSCKLRDIFFNDVQFNFSFFFFAISGIPLKRKSLQFIRTITVFKLSSSSIYSSRYILILQTQGHFLKQCEIQHFFTISGIQLNRKSLLSNPHNNLFL
jgi:hypothetical protein